MYRILTIEVSPARAAAPSRYTAGVITDGELSEALRRYWGYASFRPLQGKVVRSLLEGHDTCVVMPTGGGKSLCYQLPAALFGAQTAIVVSPLIALMQDQVAQLAQMGIPAALLNSRSRISSNRKSCAAPVKAPTGCSIFRPSALRAPTRRGGLRRFPSPFFAIDEAHCISEWGPISPRLPAA